MYLDTEREHLMFSDFLDPVTARFVKLRLYKLCYICVLYLLRSSQDLALLATERDSDF